MRIPDGQEKIRIGRGEDCDVRLDELRASREHCEIVKGAAGWKLVDLESRNGTKVNGLGVNTHLLRPGDRVEIGRAQITFLGPEGAAPPAPRPAPRIPAPAPPPPARVDVPEPVGGTVFMSRPAPAPERVRGGIGRILGLGAVAAVLLAAVGIGASVWSGWQQRQEEDGTWRRASEAEEAAGAPGTPGRLASLKAARDLYRKLARGSPSSPHRAAAEAAAERLEKEVAAGDTVEKRIASIEADRKALSPTRTRITDWRGRVQALLAETKEPEPVARLRDMLLVLDAQSGKLDEEDVGTAEGLVAADESRKEFGAALARLAPLSARDPPLPAALAARVVAARKRVTAAAEASFQTEVLAEADLLIEQEKYADARTLLERSAPRFRGVDACELAAAIKIQVVNICLSGTMNRKEAESYFKVREDVLKTAVEAEQATRERRFAEAIGIYRKIVEASDLRDVRVEFERKIEDLRVQDALWTRLRRDAASGALAAKTVGIGSGPGAARATVSGATDDAVVLSVSGGTVRKKWASLSDDELLALLAVVAGPGDDQVALALFAHVAGRAEEAERILGALLEREPVRAPDLHLLVSRLRKEPMPAGGYVLHAGRFVSAAEKRRLEASEALEALVERVRKAKRGDLREAVKALKGQP
ncbi:MAG: FHA domain-containing protein, partial [Planctomycetales bacterium]|nr:FHA domain-containing protein [Planctomycetales bacterium]